MLNNIYEIVGSGTFVGLMSGLILGFVLGYIYAKRLSKESIMPIWNVIAVVTFVSVNVYSVLTGAEVPQVFQFTMALIVGTISGIDIVKYIPALSAIGKKQ